MELIAVFRLLWRRRLLVLLGVFLAAGAAYALGREPDPVPRLRLDPRSGGHVALPTRGRRPSRSPRPWRGAPRSPRRRSGPRTIAAASPPPPASRPTSLEVTDLELTFPIIPASLPRAAVKAAYSSTRPFALNLHTDDIVPIISITADAPDRASAVRLAEAAVETLEAYTSVTANAELLGLEVRTVTPIDSVAIPGGQSRKKMAAVFVAVFGMWIAGLTLLPVLLGALRRAFAGPETVRS